MLNSNISTIIQITHGQQCCTPSLSPYIVFCQVAAPLLISFVHAVRRVAEDLDICRKETNRV